MRTPMHAILLATLVALPPLAGADDAGVVIFKDRIHLAAADDARAQGDAWKRWADDFSRDMRTSMHTMFAGRSLSAKVVKGAPYSAEVVTETNQSLADGNVITRRSTGAVYRDGEGRVRQESAGDGKDRAVFVSDPVAGKHYVLTPGAKRAMVGDLRMRHADTDAKRLVKVGKNEIRIENGKVFLDGKEVTGTTEVNTGSRSVRVENGKVFIDGKEVEAGDRRVVVKSLTNEGDGSKREEVRVQVVRAANGAEVTIPLPPPPPAPPHPAPAPGMSALPPMPPIPPLPGLQTMRFESTARLGKGVTTSLGMKDFDGVKAEGRSTVWTIPAGEIGNRSPIMITSESWYSPDLQVTVYSRYADPRTGESIYRLAGIRRAEPSADLFKVPTDYQMRDRSGRKLPGDSAG